MKNVIKVIRNGTWVIITGVIGSLICDFIKAQPLLSTSKAILFATITVKVWVILLIIILLVLCLVQFSSGFAATWSYIINKQNKTTLNEATFPGGEKAWNNYIAKNLDISIPVKNKAPKRFYTVVLSFIVDANGSITDIQTVKHESYGMVHEATRVLQNSPKWLPAMENGKKVASPLQQQIFTFQVA
jgi:hypothetical protein